MRAAEHDTDTTIIVYSGPRATRVRALWIGSAALLVVMLVGTGASLAAMTLGAGDSAIWASRAVLTGVLSAFLLAMTVGMTVYSYCYVESLELSGHPGVLSVNTVGLRGERRELVRIEDIVGARYSRGELRTVRAPWWTLRVEDRELPFVIDAQGFVAERAIFESLLSARRHAALGGRHQS